MFNIFCGALFSLVVIIMLFKVGLTTLGLGSAASVILIYKLCYR